MDEAALRSAGLANGRGAGIKILGDGELTRKLTVSAHAFSASAKAKIEAKGGTCELIAAKRAEAGKTCAWQALNLFMRSKATPNSTASDLGFRNSDTTMLSAIANTFCNCFKIPELKSRILFTLVVLAICRLEAVVRIPGLDGTVLAELLRQQGRLGRRSSVLGMYSLFTGGALEHCAVGALGIMPYISATIIIQLLTAVIPTLSKLAREEGGRTKIIQYGRYLTVLLCLGQGMVMAIGWENPEKLFPRLEPGRPAGALLRCAHLVLPPPDAADADDGTMLLMWLGEQITERGIGNGVSLVITIGILARLPQRRWRSRTCSSPAAASRPSSTSGTPSRWCSCWPV